MSGWARLAAALLLLAVCHALAGHALAVAAVVVILFAAAFLGLGWLLAATRHTWGGVAVARKARTS